MDNLADHTTLSET